MRWLNNAISSLAILSTLAALDYFVAAVFSSDASRFKNTNDDFLNAYPPSVVCSSAYTPLKNSISVSNNGWNKVS